MAGIRQNILEIWNRTSLMQRALLLAVGLVCVGGAVLLVTWVRKPDMALLYTKLSSQDAAKIVEKLRDQNVPCELKDGGTTVLVPSDRVYSLRLSMATEGLPVGDQVGYEILDKQEFGASPFQLEVGYVRAVEGELSKSIQLIDGVASARVHIVRPRTQVFAGKDKGSTATVLVKMKGGRRLLPTNVAAVVHLVAGGVEDLKPDNVVVVDGQGNLYTGEQGDETTRAPSRLHDYKAQLESDLAHKAEDLLELALGPNRAMVRVCVTLDRSVLEETKEALDKEKPALASEDITEKQTTGTGGAKGEKESTTTIKYVLPPKTTTVRRELPGKIMTKTVSAVVDLSSPQKKDAKGSSGKPLSLEDCQEIIKNAVGGLTGTDTLTVKEATFSQASGVSPDSQEGGFFTKDFLLEVLRRSSLGLLVIGALLALKMLSRPRKRKTVSATAPGGALPGAAGTPAEGLLPVGQGGEVDPQALRASITHALQENPDEVKRLFLSWVETEKGDR